MTGAGIPYWDCRHLQGTIHLLPNEQPLYIRKHKRNYRNWMLCSSRFAPHAFPVFVLVLRAFRNAANQKSRMFTVSCCCISAFPASLRLVFFAWFLIAAASYPCFKKSAHIPLRESSVNLLVNIWGVSVIIPAIESPFWRNDADMLSVSESIAIRVDAAMNIFMAN